MAEPTVARSAAAFAQAIQDVGLMSEE